MEKIIDIYGHFKGNNEMFGNNRWYGRIIVDDDKQFEGIVTANFDEDTSLVFGTIVDDLLALTKCPRNVKGIPREVLAEKRREKYVGVSSIVGDESTSDDCLITLIPADKTREESDFELDRLRKRIEDMKKDITPYGKTLYYMFQYENKQK